MSGSVCQKETMGSGKKENAGTSWTTADLLQSLLSLRGLSKLEMGHLLTTTLVSRMSVEWTLAILQTNF